MAKQKNKKHFIDTRMADAVICIVALVLLVIAIVLIMYSRTFQLFGEIVARVETDEKVVALTFDDGPLPGATEKLLDTLKDHQAKATFYLIGNEVERHPEQARKIVAAGHELGNHSYSHYPMVFTSGNFIRNEISKTDALFGSIGYKEETTFRPPYGVKLAILPYYLQSTNRITVRWDVAPDNQPEVAGSARTIADYTVEHVRPGSIILLHPMYEHRKPSLEAVGPIIDRLRAKGYRFVTVSELLQYR